MNRDIVVTTVECKKCTEMPKNFKPKKLISKSNPLANRKATNQEIKIHIGGPNYSEKIHLISFIDLLFRCWS